MVKVDGGVGCDLGTSVAESTAGGTILTRSNSGEMNHVNVVSCHELDSHVFPNGGRVGVPLPGNKTLRALVETIAWSWFSRHNVRSHKERHGKNEKRDKSVHGKHFFLKEMVLVGSGDI